MFLLGINPTFARLTADEFVATDAARAFAEKRFADALSGFRALREDHPRDVKVQRYIGITLYRLGRYAEAADALRRAIDLAPRNAAAHYFLGPVLVRLGEREAAIEAFRRARDLAPDTAYARRAERYLEGLGAAREERRTSAEEQPWDANVQIGFQYDDNVRAAPDLFPGDTEAVRAYEYVRGEYRLLERGAWRLTVEGETYHSQHFDRILDRFNIGALSGGATVDYVGEFGEWPLRLDAGYRFRVVWADYETFSLKHRITAGATLRISDDWLARVYHEVTFADFRREGFNPAIASRDGTTNASGIKIYRFLGKRRHYVWVGYEFSHTSANGRNFDRDGHEVMAGVALKLPWNMRIEGDVAYAHEAYPNFVGLRRRETNRLTYGLTLSKALSEEAAVSISYERTHELSNIRSLEFDRNVVTVALDYSF